MAMNGNTARNEMNGGKMEEESVGVVLRFSFARLQKSLYLREFRRRGPPKDAKLGT